MDGRLFDLFFDVFQIKLADVDKNSRIMDLDGWDSLKHMEFILSLENEFNIQFTGDEIASMDTINLAQAMIERKLSDS